MADYIYLVQMDVPDDLEDDFNRIYDTEYVPNILKVPGVHSCTRYKLDSSNVEGVAQYAAVYEVESPELTSSPEWQEASEKGDWATKIRPHTSNRSRSVFKRIT